MSWHGDDAARAGVQRGAFGVRPLIGVAAAAAALVAGFLLRGAVTPLPDLGVDAADTLHAVMLSNQQVYYGSLVRVTRDAVVLQDVFYVTASPDAQGNRINKLVRRAENDWHGPKSMSIPIDKVVFIEVVGPNSSVAKLVSDARARAP